MSSTPTPSDPQTNWTTYVQEYQDIQNQWNNDQSTLQASLAKLLTMLKNPGEALLYAEINVLPNIMATKGDQVGVSGATENLASGLRSFITHIQNDFNSISSMKPADAAVAAKDMVNMIGQLHNILADPKYASLISTGTASDLDASLKAIYQTITGSGGAAGIPPSGSTPAVPPKEPTPNPYWPAPGQPFAPQPNDVTNIVFNIQQIFFPSTPTPGVAPGFDPNITLITNNFTTASADVSTFSSTQTSNEQYLNNVFNQIQGVLSDLFQSSSTLNNLLVQNEKSN